jgi:HK97 family phage major capsid protein
VPIDDLISYPLLHSELLPYVMIRDLPRGSSIEVPVVDNPTVVWGNGEGTAQDVFDATSLISQLTGDIEPVACYVEVGRDFMSDSVIAIGQELVLLIGEAMKNSLDYCVAVGDGTTQPEGLFTTSGVGSIASGSGTDGPYVVGDIEGLMFGLGKQYRNAGSASIRYITSDTAYRRIRQIPVGTSDERRIFGMDHRRYTLFDYGVSIQNDVANGSVGFGDLKRYRLWRRQGVSAEWTTQGETLMRKNTALLAVRGRFYGKLCDVNAFVKLTDGDQTDG